MARKKPQQSPAFPQAELVESVARRVGAPGLTDRQIFAAVSLLGIRVAGHEMDAPMAARKAFLDADAMLAEGGTQ